MFQGDKTCSTVRLPLCRSGYNQPGAGSRRPPSGMRGGRIPTGARPPYRMPTGIHSVYTCSCVFLVNEVLCVIILLCWLTWFQS